MFHSLTRLEDLAPYSYQLLAQKEILGLKPRLRANRDPIASSSWVRNATIGRFLNIRPSARHLG